MTQYVLVHATKVDCDGPYDDVLLILKDKPAYLKGKLNLCGGKIEEGESVIDAAVRELEEESGFKPCSKPLYCGKIVCSDCEVHCVSVEVDEFESRWYKPREEETETVMWYTRKAAFDDPRLMPNLRVIIPLLYLKVCGWTIFDVDTATSTAHTFSIKFDLPS